MVYCQDMYAQNNWVTIVPANSYVNFGLPGNPTDSSEAPNYKIYNYRVDADIILNGTLMIQNQSFSDFVNENFYNDEDNISIDSLPDSLLNPLPIYMEAMETWKPLLL